MNRGTYLEHDGQPAVRFQRTYQQPVERVWTAVTDPEELAHWFPSRVQIEPRVGGTVLFSGDPHMDDTKGVVLAYDPPHRLGFDWGGDELHFTLEPTKDGGCQLTLLNVLKAEDTAARNASGWHVCLDGLAALLAGSPWAGPHSDSATPWEPLYAAYLADDVPSGAPIPPGS